MTVPAFLLQKGKGNELYTIIRYYSIFSFNLSPLDFSTPLFCSFHQLGCWHGKNPSWLPRAQLLLPGVYQLFPIVRNACPTMHNIITFHNLPRHCFFVTTTILPHLLRYQYSSRHHFNLQKKFISLITYVCQPPSVHSSDQWLIASLP